MSEWHSAIRSELPYWEDFSGLIHSFDVKGFPSPRDLTLQLAPGVCNAQGMPIRFVASSDIPDINYEAHIYNSGQVSTRENSWHDLFNAWAWIRYPAIKAAINAVHVQAIAKGCEPGRGKHRDALTLFDECGVVVVSERARCLEQISARDWQETFQGEESGISQCEVFVFGHAMLEKFLRPYKAMTANALLLQVPPACLAQSRDVTGRFLDQQLSQMILSGEILGSSADLSPLPLMGIPGWWPDGVQNEDFYTDQQVFRPPPESFCPAAVFVCSKAQN